MQDCWLVIFDRVLDVSPLFAEGHGLLAEPMLAAAGGDVSHWFVQNAEDGLPDLKTHVDPVSGLRTPYCPDGRFIHVPELSPRTDSVTESLPWWRNQSYHIGRLSTRARRVRLINTLTSHDHDMTVAAECTVSDVQEKYLGHNAHAGGYTWKSLVRGEFRPLDMGKTMHENEVEGAAEAEGQAEVVPGGADELLKLGMDPDHLDNIPVLMLYFNDNLTIA